MSKARPNGTANDIQLAGGPDDTVSDLRWSPAGNYLAVASWDGNAKVYDIGYDASSGIRAMIPFDAPVLSCSWSKDGTKFIGAGVDRTARILDLTANGASAHQVAAHDGPVSSVHFVEILNSNSSMVFTGSWDRNVKIWDLRQQVRAISLGCRERVYTMDVREKLCVIGTAERHIHIVDLNNPMTFHSSLESPFKKQTRVISCMLDASGFAIGSIEGRCGFHYIEQKNQSANFTFKCRREQDSRGKADVYAINSISFHPKYPTSFSTAGSDGTFHFLDKDIHTRLTGFPPVGGSIPATAFNNDGSIFAYAVGYDWSKGFAYNSPQYLNKVMLHPVNDEECKRRDIVKK